MRVFYGYRDGTLVVEASVYDKPKKDIFVHYPNAQYPPYNEFGEYKEDPLDALKELVVINVQWKEVNLDSSLKVLSEVFELLLKLKLSQKQAGWDGNFNADFIISYIQEMREREADNLKIWQFCKQTKNETCKKCPYILKCTKEAKKK